MSNPILIVDDSKTLRISMQKMIEELGHSAVQAETGLEGLEALKANPQIRLVLVDYNMPDMNGIEMVSEIKKQPQFSHVNCVIITSIGQEGNALLQAAKAAGVVAWLTKPIQLNQLQNLINKLGQ